MFTSFFTGFARLSPAKAARQAVGIDVGSSAIKAIQVELAAAGTCKVVAALSRPRSASGPMSPEEAQALADALRGSGFTGQDCVLAASPSDAVLGTIELPPRSSNAPLDQLARMEMARNAKLAPDAFELAWWELPNGVRAGRGTHAMAAAVPHNKADAQLDAAESAGFEPVSLDLEPVALARACATSIAPGGITALLDLGAGPATLSFIHQGVLTFNRRMPEVVNGLLCQEFAKRLAIEPDVAEFLLTEVGVGGGAARTSDGDAVELPDEGRRLLNGFVETLTKELALSFDYAGHLYPDAPVNRLLLVGGGAAIGGLADRLTGALSVQTKRVAPVDLAPCEPALLSICSSPAMTLALGLAMRSSPK